MEPNELRSAFFAEVRGDPYLHLVTHHVAHAWAHGYEQALRDHDIDPPARQTHGENFDAALEWLTEERRRSEADALVAFASLAKLMPPRAPKIEAPKIEAPPADDFMARITRDWTRKLAAEYAQGIAHGMRTTLLLLLGEGTDGAPAFPGPLTPETERWARESLARVEAELGRL